MNATPLLLSLLAGLAEVKVEVVLIGNAAAAIQGAPVTTIDFDFMFRDTPTNLRKLKMAAKALPAIAMRPYYPVSKLYRMVNDAGLAAQSDRHLEDLIARRLALPVEKRINFLRRRLPGGGSCL